MLGHPIVKEGYVASAATERKARRHPDIRAGGGAGVDRLDAARVVAARRQRGGDQRRRQPADARLPARVSHAGGRPWRPRIGDRSAHCPRHRRFRPGGGHAAPWRSGAPAVRPGHRRHRLGFRRVRPRLGDAQAEARTHGRGQRVRRAAHGARAVRRHRQPPRRDAGARHRPDDRPAAQYPAGARGAGDRRHRRADLPRVPVHHPAGASARGGAAANGEG